MGRVTPLLTSNKVLNITYQQQETTTSETLPTTEPDTPQVSYTVAGGDIPTFSVDPYSKKWVALVYATGRFVTAGTLSWRMKKNGSSVATGTKAVSANYYYTVSAFFYDVVVGDVLEIALWSTVTNSTYTYKAYQIQVTRMIFFSKMKVILPCNFATVAQKPVLTLGGNPASYSDAGLYPQHCDIALPTITAAKNYPSLYIDNTYGAFRLNHGDNADANTALSLSSSTYRPNYYRNLVPTQIIFRGLRID